VRVIQQEFLQAALRVTAADPPDGGAVAFQPSSDRLDRFPGSDSENDPGMLDLEPSQSATVRHGLQDRGIRSSQGQGARFPSAHAATSNARIQDYCQHTPAPEIVAAFMARATRDRRSGVWRRVVDT